MSSLVDKLAADPAMQFMCSEKVNAAIHGNMRNAPWSRLSGTRIGKVGFALMKLRAKELDLDEPTEEQAYEVERKIRENRPDLTRGERLDVEDYAAKWPS